MAKDKQKGVSLIMTFFIMVIILGVVLSISVILYSEVKVMTDIGNSVASYYAAESGAEKVLYYDRQVIPTGATRGLCSIFSSCVSGSTGETSIYCNFFTPTPTGCPSSITLNPGAAGGCNLNTCNNCAICFATVFDNRTYYTTAKVYPTPGYSNFEIDSKGVFGGGTGAASRQIQILISAAQP